METGLIGNDTSREIQPTDCVMAVMGQDGDTKTVWDKNSPVEVENAKTTFDNFKSKGYLAYKVAGREGDKGEIMKEFDPSAERMILAPPLAGG